MFSLKGGLGPEVEKELPLHIYRCGQLVWADQPRTVKVT